MSNNDEGSALLLSIFASVLCLGVVISVADATSLYIERKRLFSVADGMALAAADNYDFAEISVDANGPHFRLTAQQVKTAAEKFYRMTSRGTQSSVKLIAATSPDGKTAHVEVETKWVPPVISLFFPSGFPIRATANARTVFSDGLSHR